MHKTDIKIHIKTIFYRYQKIIEKCHIKNGIIRKANSGRTPFEIKLDIRDIKMHLLEPI